MQRVGYGVHGSFPQGEFACHTVAVLHHFGRTGMIEMERATFAREQDAPLLALKPLFSESAQRYRVSDTGYLRFA